MSLAVCPSFAVSTSSWHSRSPGEQVTSQNVCTLLYAPPRGIQGHQVSRSPAECLYFAVFASSWHSRSPGQQVTTRMSVLCCIRLLRAFNVTRSEGHQPKCLYSAGQQVTSSMSVLRCIRLLMACIRGHQCLLTLCSPIIYVYQHLQNISLVLKCFWCLHPILGLSLKGRIPAIGTSSVIRVTSVEYEK